MNMDIAEFLSMKDKISKHDGTLHGHVTIHRRNKETGEEIVDLLAYNLWKTYLFEDS